MFDVVAGGTMVMRMKRVNVRYSGIYASVVGVRSGFVL